MTVLPIGWSLGGEGKGGRKCHALNSQGRHFQQFRLETAARIYVS